MCVCGLCACVSVACVYVCGVCVCVCLIVCDLENSTMRKLRDEFGL